MFRIFYFSVFLQVDSEYLLLARLMARYCFARWRLSSSVTLPAGQPPGARAVRRPTLHGGPVVLRPVKVTPCFGVIYKLINL